MDARKKSIAQHTSGQKKRGTENREERSKRRERKEKRDRERFREIKNETHNETEMNTKTHFSFFCQQQKSRGKLLREL